MVINLQFFGGRGASSGISEKGNAYGTQYKILLEYENIKFVTNAGKNYEVNGNNDQWENVCTNWW